MQQTWLFRGANFAFRVHSYKAGVFHCSSASCFHIYKVVSRHYEYCFMSVYPGHLCHYDHRGNTTSIESGHCLPVETLCHGIPAASWTWGPERMSSSESISSYNKGTSCPSYKPLIIHQLWKAFTQLCCINTTNCCRGLVIGMFY